MNYKSAMTRSKSDILYNWSIFKHNIKEKILTMIRKYLQRIRKVHKSKDNPFWRHLFRQRFYHRKCRKETQTKNKPIKQEYNNKWTKMKR